MNANGYTIDHAGKDGQWRVWWLNESGYTVERLFDSRQAAQRWVDFMESTEQTAEAR